MPLGMDKSQKGIAPLLKKLRSVLAPFRYRKLEHLFPCSEKPRVSTAPRTTSNSTHPPGLGPGAVFLPPPTRGAMAPPVPIPTSPNPRGLFQVWTPRVGLAGRAHSEDEWAPQLPASFCCTSSQASTPAPAPAPKPAKRDGGQPRLVGSFLSPPSPRVRPLASAAPAPRARPARPLTQTRAPAQRG